ncbi:MAG: transposase [archaeon]|nr:transposase [archaeon]
MINVSEDNVEIEFITLDCGHTVTPEIGIGVCSKCSKVCCSKCLQLIDEKLFCPECFARFVRDNDG